MLLLFLLVLLASGGVLVLTFLLGFRLGSDHFARELSRVRLETARAQQDIFDLTTQAIAAMAHEAARRRQ